MRKALAALALIASPLALATDLGGDGLGGPSLQPRAQSVQLGEPGIANREISQVDPVLIEAGEPALDFRFAKNKNLIESTTNKSSLITFSRSAAQSPGTYVGSDGLIHDAAVNLALYSEQFDNAAWVKSNATVKANQVVAPDGKQTADKIEENGATGVHRIDDTASVVTGGVYTLSVYFKAAERDRVLVRTFDGGANLSVACKSDGTIANIEGTPEASTNEDVGNGWKRCSMTYRIAGGTTGYMRIGPIDAGSSASYAGTDGNGIYLWGAQLEETDPATMQPTAYIHTTSQALAAPRFDHVPTTGNLTTNLVTYSEMFDQSAWLKLGGVTVDQNIALAPDGTQTADRFNFNGTTNGRVEQTTGASGTVTQSVYMRTESGTQTVIIGPASASLSTVTVTTEWQRFSHTGTGAYPRIRSDDAGSILVWGAQLEASPTAGPYVRTLSQTRSISDANAESLGLLVEEARANAYKHSQNFIQYSFWNTSSVTVSASSEYGPHGQFFEVGSSVANTEHIVYASSSNFTQAVGTWTETVFLKYDNWQHVFIGSNGSSSANWAGVIVDLVNGTITDTQSNGTFTLNSSSIENYGDTFRVRITITSVTDGHRGLRIRFSNSATPVYGGYGSINFSGDANDKILIGGAQAEAGSFPTSYIPTTGSSQTRYADVAAVQDEDFSTTNLLAYSESFDVGWTTSRVTINENVVNGPFAGGQADEFRPGIGAGNAYIVSPTPTASGQTFSVYVKPNGVDWMILGGPISSDAAWFDLQNIAVGTKQPNVKSASIQGVGDGWLLAQLTTTSAGSNATAIYAADADNNTIMTGDGSKSMYLWGASLTATEYPVEYTTTRNLLTDSQDFERSGWVKVNSSIVDDDVTQAPDGTNSADRIRKTATSLQGLRQNSVTVPGVVVESVYAKKDSVNNISFTNGSVPTLNISLVDGSILANGGAFSDVSVTDAGNGWFRIAYSRNASSGVFPLYMWPTDRNDLNFGTYSSTASVFVWGAQLEPGTATDYVRTVDVVGKAYQWYEPTEGTVFADVVPAYDGAQSASVVAFNTTTYQESNIIYKANSTSTGTGLRWVAQTFDGATQATLPTPTDIADVEASLAFGYKHNDFVFGVEGSLIGPDPTGTTPNPSQMHIMNRDGSLHLNGHIKRLTYWPRRQSDSTLQVITQ